MARYPEEPGCTCYRLIKAARLATRMYDQQLQPSGLNVGQFALLSTLGHMSGNSITQISKILATDRTTLTRNLSPLQRLGLVEVREGKDRRSRALHLTDKGKAAFKVAVPLWRKAQKRVERALGPTERDSLHAVLDRTIKHLEHA